MEDAMNLPCLESSLVELRDAVTSWELVSLLLNEVGRCYQASARAVKFRATNVSARYLACRVSAESVIAETCRTDRFRLMLLSCLWTCSAHGLAQNCLS